MYRYYIIALLVVLFDQWTKWLVIKKMDLYESVTVIDHFLYITSYRNRGAAWGILQEQMGFFYIVTIIVVFALLYYLHRHAKGKPLQALAIALILGGAIGNFIDRLFRKEVVDFIDVMIFSYDYPIFNVADSFLVIGVIIIFIASVIEERKGKMSHE